MTLFFDLTPLSSQPVHTLHTLATGCRKTSETPVRKGYASVQNCVGALIGWNSETLNRPFASTQTVKLDQSRRAELILETSAVELSGNGEKGPFPMPPRSLSVLEISGALIGRLF